MKDETKIRFYLLGIQILILSIGCVTKEVLLIIPTLIVSFVMTFLID